MKKILILLLISTSMLNAMEEQSGWATLPHEIQSQILSYVPRLENYQNLMRVNKQFNNLVTNPLFFKKFIEREGLNKPGSLENIVQIAAKRGKNPLAVAFAQVLINEHPQIANKLFIEWGITHQNYRLADLLLEAGIDPNSRDLSSPVLGWTALDWAIISQSLEGVRLLLDKGANPNLKDHSGQTPLMWAANTAKKDIVQLLLDRGADASAQTADGETALTIARPYNLADLNKLLKDTIEGTPSHT